VYTIASSIHIPYLLEQAPQRLLNFSQLKCRAYSRAALISGWGLIIQKLDAAKPKNAENRLLALTNFLAQMRRLFQGGACSGAKLTVNHAKT